MKNYRPPAFQFYANDWLSSPKINAMTPAQEGGYIRLLAYQWADDECGIKKSDLVSLSRLDETQLARVVQNFEQHPVNQEKIYNVRMYKQKLEMMEYHKSCSSGGKKGMRNRWHNKGVNKVVTDPLITDGIRSDNTSSSSSSESKPFVHPEGADEPANIYSRKGFDEFWKAYPRRQNKKKAYDAFCRIKPDGELVAKFLAAIEVQKKSPEWTKENGSYIPLPVSWLNGHRWLDEIQCVSVRGLQC